MTECPPEIFKPFMAKSVDCFVCPCTALASAEALSLSDLSSSPISLSYSENFVNPPQSKEANIVGVFSIKLLPGFKSSFST